VFAAGENLRQLMPTRKSPAVGSKRVRSANEQLDFLFLATEPPFCAKEALPTQKEACKRRHKNVLAHVNNSCDGTARICGIYANK
jgi:hypothetical protein